MTFREHQEVVGSKINGGQRRSDIFHHSIIEIGSDYGLILASCGLPYEGKPMNDNVIKMGIRGIVKGLSEMCFAREWDLEEIIEGDGDVFTEADREED